MAFPKLRLTPRLLWFAYRFVDVEASGEAAAPPDGRIIEYSFVIAKLGSMKPGKVLDVGCTARFNYLPAALALLGWEVYGIDQREWKFKFPNFHFVREDIRHTSFPDNFFDVIYDISAIEHIGIAGRYGVTEEDPKGDIKEVREIARVLRGGGRFLVTMPYGKEYKVIKPKGRVYDERSLQRLFDGWEIKDKVFYSQDSEGFWNPVVEEEAWRLGKDKEALALLELILPK